MQDDILLATFTPTGNIFLRDYLLGDFMLIWFVKTKTEAFKLTADLRLKNLSDK